VREHAEEREVLQQRYVARLREQSSQIYFVLSVRMNLIKIGFTAQSLALRLRELQTGSADELRLIATMPGDQEAEAQLHDRFLASKVRTRSEWFHPTPQLLAFIKERASLREPWPASFAALKQADE
jgi:hypothetical protein